VIAMSKSTTLLGASFVLLLSMSVCSAQAKDSYELNQEANELQNKADNKSAAADAEQSETSLAVADGKKGTAAKHAKRAATEQDKANDLAEKADKKKHHADVKAVKESY